MNAAKAPAEKKTYRIRRRAPSPSPPPSPETRINSFSPGSRRLSLRCAGGGLRHVKVRLSTNPKHVPRDVQSCINHATARVEWAQHYGLITKRTKVSTPPKATSPPTSPRKQKRKRSVFKGGLKEKKKASPVRSKPYAGGQSEPIMGVVETRYHGWRQVVNAKPVSRHPSGKVTKGIPFHLRK